MKYTRFAAFFAAIFMIFALYGCATVQLDSVEDRMAAFEISYQEVLKTVILYRDEGRFGAEEWKSVQEMVKNVKVAREAAYLAMQSGDLSLASNKLVLASQALQALRQVVMRKDAQATGQWDLTVVWPAASF